MQARRSWRRADQQAPQRRLLPTLARAGADDPYRQHQTELAIRVGACARTRRAANITPALHRTRPRTSSLRRPALVASFNREQMSRDSPLCIDRASSGNRAGPTPLGPHREQSPTCSGAGAIDCFLTRLRGAPSAAVGAVQCGIASGGNSIGPRRQAARGNAAECRRGIQRSARRAERREASDGARVRPRQLARNSTPCNRPISARRNTRLKRSWQEADTCSSSVELTLITVTSPAARIVALRLAPCT